MPGDLYYIWRSDRTVAVWIDGYLTFVPEGTKPADLMSLQMAILLMADIPNCRAVKSGEQP